MQFSIEHSCFSPPHRKTLRDAAGRAYAREVGDYFRRVDGEVDEWVFAAVPPEVREGVRPFRVPCFTRTLSKWLNLLVEAGLVLERFGKPYPSDEAVRASRAAVRTGRRLFSARPGEKTCVPLSFASP